MKVVSSLHKSRLHFFLKLRLKMSDMSFWIVKKYVSSSFQAVSFACTSKYSSYAFKVTYNYVKICEKVISGIKFFIQWQEMWEIVSCWCFSPNIFYLSISKIVCLRYFCSQFTRKLWFTNDINVLQVNTFWQKLIFTCIAQKNVHNYFNHRNTCGVSL